MVVLPTKEGNVEYCGSSDSGSVRPWRTDLEQKGGLLGLKEILLSIDLDADVSR